jgi:hypothetical protein
LPSSHEFDLATQQPQSRSKKAKTTVTFADAPASSPSKQDDLDNSQMSVGDNTKVLT